MERLIALLLALPAKINPAEFVVCGSGPLAVRGIRDVHDLDLLVSERVIKEIQRGEIEGFALSSHYDTRAVYVLDTPAGKIDVFASTPRTGRTLAEVPVERYEVPGVGRVAFLTLRHVLAIKALAPSAPKHVEDMIMIASRIAAEEGGAGAVLPPPEANFPAFEVATGHVEGGREI